MGIRVEYRLTMKISAKRMALLGWLMALLLPYVAVTYLLSNIKTDYTTFYSSLQLLLEGKNIYTPVPINSLDFIDIPTMTRDTLYPNLNPPIFTLLFSPLGLLPYEASFWVWFLLSLAFGLSAVAAVWHAMGRPNHDAMLALALLLLCYFPTFASTLLGQTSLLVFMLVAGGWMLAREGRDRSGGVLLGLALAMKIFLGLFLVFFLAQRRWRLLAWMLASFAACWMLGLFALGPEAYGEYVRMLQSITWHSSNWNASAYGFFTRIFGGSENVPLIDSQPLGLALYGCLSLLLVAGIIRHPRPGPDQDASLGFDLGFSFTLVASLLIAPLGWMYYFQLLLIPFLVLYSLATSRALGWAFKGTCILALFLSSFPQLLIAPEDSPQFAFTRAAVYSYALILLAVQISWSSHALLPSRTCPAARGCLTDRHLIRVFLGFLLYYAVIGTWYWLQSA